MQTIICPHCKTEIEISQALHDQVLKQVQEDQKEKFKEELEKAREEEKEKTAKRIREELELKLKDQASEAEEAKARSKKLQEEILELTKSMRQLREKDEQREIEMQKKLAEDEEKIRIEEQKKAAEEQHKKLLEKDKQLADALKEVEDMKRKLQQGSQQLQGEAFEIEFENILANQYPNDKIAPVGKGIRGGDIVQEVWDKNGICVGKILWELKNTKTWQEPWIEKLKGDKRAINADEAILISEILPSNIQLAGFRSNVWVTKRSFVIPLADTMRAKLIQLYYVRRAAEGKDEKIEVLYSYLSGNEFKNRIEAIVEAFSSMQTEIEKEKRYFSNKWARDEKNIRQVIDNTYGMHGDLKAIIGGVLPAIKGLDLLSDGVE